MYATYAYYIDEYLAGMNPKVSESEYTAWERKARAEIDLRTFGRLEKLEDVPQKVKDCTCELLELLHEVDAFQTANASNGAAGALVSYSNDGVSGTFATDQNSIYTEEGLKRKINAIITTWLANTGLLSCRGRVKAW